MRLLVDVFSGFGDSGRIADLLRATEAVKSAKEGHCRRESGCWCLPGPRRPPFAYNLPNLVRFWQNAHMSLHVTVSLKSPTPCEFTSEAETLKWLYCFSILLMLTGKFKAWCKQRLSQGP